MPALPGLLPTTVHAPSARPYHGQGEATRHYTARRSYRRTCAFVVRSYAFPADESDAATIRTTRPGELRVEDLFVPDPRPWRPLRYVRKVDPRQMLILCAGAALTPGQVAAMKVGSDASSVFTANTSATRFGGGASDAASIYSSIPTDFSVEATRKAMFGAGKLPDYKSLEAQLKSSSASAPVCRRRGETCWTRVCLLPYARPSCAQSGLQAQCGGHCGTELLETT